MAKQEVARWILSVPNAAATVVASTARPPKIWKFWGTTLWGLFVFAAMFAGQLAVFGYFMLRQPGPLDVHAAAADRPRPG